MSILKIITERQQLICANPHHWRRMPIAIFLWGATIKRYRGGSMSFIHEESQTAQEARPVQGRQSQTTQTSTAETTLENLTHFSFIPLDNLLDALTEMDVPRLSSLCRSLHIDAALPVESLRSYAEKLDEMKYLFFLRLLNPVELFHPTCQAETLHPALIQRFALGFRFRGDFTQTVFAGPFFVGNRSYSETFSVKLSKLLNKRIIVQSLSQTDAIFPRSLTIWIGDTKIVDGSCLRSCEFLDITDLIVREKRVLIEVQAGFEDQWFCIALRSVEEVPFDQLLDQVLTRRLNGESDSCLCCPISKKVMKVPVRSRACRHGQCVDLKALLNDRRGGLVCPVCGESVAFDDLAVDMAVLERLGTVRVRKQHSLLRGQPVGTRLASSGN
jgi:hypothetical protein